MSLYLCIPPRFLVLAFNIQRPLFSVVVCFLLPSSAFFLFLFIYFLFVWPGAPCSSQYFCLSSFLLRRTTLELWGDLWILTSFLGLQFPLGSYPVRLYLADPWHSLKLLFWSPGLLSLLFIHFPALSILNTTISQSLQPKMPLAFTFLTNSLLFVNVRSSTSPHCLLDHFEEEVTISILQDHHGFLMPCCVVLPADNWMIEVTHEGHSVWMWGFLERA